MTTDELIKAIKEAGYEPTAYSGRAMYGKYCVAVHLDRYDNGESLPSDGARFDDMGRGSVIYWPHHPAPEDL